MPEAGFHKTTRAGQSPPGRRRGRNSWAAGLTLTAALLLSGCGDQSAAQKPERARRPVLTERVRFEARGEARTFVAQIRPRIESDLGFRVTGKVARRLVEVGERVVPGQPLASLDDTDLRLQLEQADAEVKAAAGNLAQSAAEERRIQDLRSKGWSTESAFDKQRAAADEARGRKAKADRALSLAQNALGYATLVSDTAGVVTAALIEPGLVVSAGQPAVRVARLEDKEALVAIPEGQVAALKSATASLSLWNNPAKLYRSALRELAPSADAATRTYAARFSIPDAGDDVQFGMTATVTIVDAGGGRIARLPLSALFNQGAGPCLWVVDPGTGVLTLKPVEVAAYDAVSVLIKGGVADNEYVVTLGVQKLDPGQKVKVVQTLGS